MIIVTTQGFMKMQRIINPKSIYGIVMHGKRVYESEVYSKRVFENLRKGL